VSADPDVPCVSCPRVFESHRALTQHRRYVHEGASLFGLRLVDGSGGLIEPETEDWSGLEPNEEGEEGETAPESLDSSSYLLAAAAGLAVLVILALAASRTETPPLSSDAGISRYASGLAPRGGRR
jgi:hypothetical protein